MKLSKRCLSILLIILIFSAFFTGCNRTSDPQNDDPEFVYVPEFTSLPDTIENVGNICISSGKIYFVSWEYKSVDPSGNVLEESDPMYYQYMTSFQTLNSLSIGSNELQAISIPDPQIPIDITDNYFTDIYMNNFVPAEDGNLWIYQSVNVYHYDLPEDFDPQTGDAWSFRIEDGSYNYLRKISPDGSELASIDISNMQEDSNDYFYINSIASDSSGNLYVCVGTTATINIFDSQGNMAGEIELSEDDWTNMLITMGDGRVAALTYEFDEVSGISGNVLKPINAASGTFDDSIPILDSAYYLYPGDSKYLVYYTSGTNFFGLNSDTLESEKILNWINCDINSDSISYVSPQDENSILCLVASYSSDGSAYELVNLSKTPSSEVPEKTVLTYATLSMDYNVRSAIINFNKSSSTHRIEVKDYSEFNTQGDYSAGLTKLTTEIISGVVPDILDTNGLPISQYAAKGVLEDLYPLIDADPDFNREDLVEPVLRALENDGKLYQIYPGFGIYTMVGRASVLGSEPGWTLDDFMQLHSSLGDIDYFDAYSTRSTVFGSLLPASISEFVDWNTGKCSFDSQSFINLLNFVNSFPESYGDYSWSPEDDSYLRLFRNQQMASILYGSDIWSFKYYFAVLGDDIVFKGLPVGAESGSAIMTYSSGFAISSSCADKDAAWQFIRTFLDEKYQTDNVWYFPINKNVFDKKIEEAMTPNTYTDPVTGEEVVYEETYYVGDMEFSLGALTEKQVDLILGAIESADRTMSYDENIMDIINEGTAAFFAGQKSAEETARLIQSSASLYVNEQK